MITHFDRISNGWIGYITLKLVYISLGNNTPSVQLSERHLEDPGGWAVSDSANIANDCRE